MDAFHSQPVAIEPPPEPLPFLRFLRTLVRNPLRTWPLPVYQEGLFRTAGTRGDALFVMAPELIRQVLLDEADSFTKQVIQEAMRLYPPAALLSRQASRALRIGGEEIAPGTLVYVPIYAVHRHRAYWDMPDSFDPSRFAPQAVKARDRYTYLPFGAGPRACIGMTFAQMEAAAVLAVLLPSLSLRLRPGYVPEPKLSVTLRPAKGMPMRIGRAA